MQMRQYSSEGAKWDSMSIINKLTINFNGEVSIIGNERIATIVAVMHQ